MCRVCEDTVLDAPYVLCAVPCALRSAGKPEPVLSGGARVCGEQCWRRWVCWAAGCNESEYDDEYTAMYDDKQLTLLASSNDDINVCSQLIKGLQGLAARMNGLSATSPPELPPCACRQR